MNDIEKKTKNLVDKINNELKKLGSTTRMLVGQTITEDTGEFYSTVEVNMGGQSVYRAYASPNAVGIKTFLQGILASLQLVSGNYRMKPLSEIARRRLPDSIIPRLSHESAVAARPAMGKKARLDAAKSPRFALQRSKYLGNI